MHLAQAVEMSEILLEKDDIETRVSTLAEMDPKFYPRSWR
ncbi:uncharacterized protein (DUF305 family) [Nesterenkonia lutea]|uniref:Uncharacterized protein (DUF305 family) n=1 Tax=Nesterenkonia lutea TaxID=272919 RepID=A0ABR9JGD5_9MICC|nr:uncharacterized protein (DUF305 family) [Nesterenkonia lutea]